MNGPSLTVSDTQIPMPGMPETLRPLPVASPWSLVPGQEVLYVGKIGGGPGFGARGIVRRALARKAVVDLGRWGIWHVPYHFLTLPHAVSLSSPPDLEPTAQHTRSA